METCQSIGGGGGIFGVLPEQAWSNFGTTMDNSGALSEHVWNKCGARLEKRWGNSGANHKETQHHDPQRNRGPRPLRGSSDEAPGRQPRAGDARALSRARRRQAPPIFVLCWRCGENDNTNACSVKRYVD